MSILFLMVPIALGIVLIAVVAFIWAGRSGQFDDLDTPGLRMLHDDPARRPAPDRPPPDTLSP
jgi:cbb3-type cytochrome oxidase maturation protein